MTRVSFKAVEARVIHIPPLASIMWYLPEGQGSFTGCGKLMVISLPAGNASTIYWSTLRGWILRDVVTISQAAYSSWQEAAAAMFPAKVEYGV
jgi:hypothetical protein